MDDQVDPLTTGPHEELQLSHRRILLLMAASAVIGVLLGTLFGGLRFGFGVIVGAVFAFANYLWQRRAMQRIFDKAARGEKPFLPALAYIVRYIVLGAVVWFAYATGILPVLAVVAGFGAFSIAIVIEGVIGIFSGPRRIG